MGGVLEMRYEAMDNSEQGATEWCRVLFVYHAIAWLSSSANFWTERLIFSCVRGEGWRLPQTYCDSCVLLMPVIRDMPDNVRMPL